LQAPLRVGELDAVVVSDQSHREPDGDVIRIGRHKRDGAKALQAAELLLVVRQVHRRATRALQPSGSGTGRQRGWLKSALIRVSVAQEGEPLVQRARLNPPL